jgi:hypothetical protein
MGWPRKDATRDNRTRPNRKPYERRPAGSPHLTSAERTAAWRLTPRGKALRKEHKERPENREAARDRTRAYAAKRDGIAPPPLERDCPPRPADGRCDCCLQIVIGPFHLDHDHVTGAFRAWACNTCNTGAGIMDDPDRLQRRIEFLRGKLPWQ